MKQILLIIYFTIVTIIKTFSQVDTTSSLDFLLKQGHDKVQNTKTINHKFGYSIFNGLGIGGNHFYNGISLGASARAHYKFHTINIYTSFAKKREEIYFKDYTNNLYSSNYGFTYGPGFYSKYFAASCGIGLGYYWTTIDMNKFISQPSYDKPTYVTYKKIATCISAQLTIHTRYVGLTGQLFCNTANPLTNYTFLLGAEFIIW